MHPGEQLLHDAYAAFAHGDLPAFLALCDDSINFHVPGSSPLAGTYTKATFPGMVGQVMQISAGTFGETPVLVVANDDHGVVVLDHFLQRDGKRIQYRTDHLWQISNGKLSRWEERPGDQAAFDRTWS